ncbi:hypothetical protein HanRHA438_Chr14g0679721 [Helianthus annuus]|nr:hypothetical protein HanRHA438_Chr14g0679721 [Helianthus annuus]
MNYLWVECKKKSIFFWKPFKAKVTTTLCITIFSLKTPKAHTTLRQGVKRCQIVLMPHNRHRPPTLTRPRICAATNLST